MNAIGTIHFTEARGAHGLLFLWATATLLYVLSRSHLSPFKGAGVFAASLIPFAGLWSHRMLVRSMRSRDKTPIRS